MRCQLKGCGHRHSSSSKRQQPPVQRSGRRRVWEADTLRGIRCRPSQSVTNRHINLMEGCDVSKECCACAYQALMPQANQWPLIVPASCDIQGEVSAAPLPS
jgi:hypothetical protein